MAEIDDYQKYLDSEKTAKNLASLVMMILSVFLFITYTIVPQTFFGITAHTLKIILISAGIVLMVGGLYVRFIHITDYQSEY